MNKFNIGDSFYINLKQCEEYWKKDIRNSSDWIDYCRNNYTQRQLVTNLDATYVYNNNMAYFYNEVMSVKEYEFKEQLRLILDDLEHLHDTSNSASNSTNGTKDFDRSVDNDDVLF